VGPARRQEVADRTRVRVISEREGALSWARRAGRRWRTRRGTRALTCRPRWTSASRSTATATAPPAAASASAWCATQACRGAPAAPGAAPAPVRPLAVCNPVAPRAAHVQLPFVGKAVAISCSVLCTAGCCVLCSAAASICCERAMQGQIMVAQSLANVTSHVTACPRQARAHTRRSRSMSAARKAHRATPSRAAPAPRRRCAPTAASAGAARRAASCCATCAQATPRSGRAPRS